MVTNGDVSHISTDDSALFFIHSAQVVWMGKGLSTCLAPVTYRERLSLSRKLRISSSALRFTISTCLCRCKDTKFHLNPNRSLDFMSALYLFRADCSHRHRRRSGLRRDGDVDKMPKEIQRWYKETLLETYFTICRSNDRFGLNTSTYTK